VPGSDEQKNKRGSDRDQHDQMIEIVALRSRTGSRRQRRHADQNPGERNQIGYQPCVPWMAALSEDRKRTPDQR